ncbi:ABC-2 type transport system ATP-binding protein [Pedobacter sp. AK017]|uniref:ABC transporter ATP-binding protein n=1 Tax=Pedobacter sp. AK017 TaxID=2723073 RepID=UPI0016110E83|nr:ABC transporter ATP-binding protein [Pedobacter sp. AK017]MBB5441231.1 ABC-2 type transport system ATP-binding protein [Pedobacter sp. AK017]
MITLNNVSMHFPVPKRYLDYLRHPFRSAQFIALTKVNMTIETGDRVVFLGVNGAGKTTLLKLIGGLLYPTSGEILVNGFNTVSQNLEARGDVGFVLNEERSFYWRLTGRQNLDFFGMLDNLNADLLKTRIHELFHLVGLDGAADKAVANYSSGMKQRLALARGLLNEPQILILDEPTRTLDPQAVIDIKDLISHKIHDNRKITLLIATHKFDEAEELCTKICIVKQGQIVAYQRMKDVKENFGSIADFYHTTMMEREGCYEL